MVLGGQKVLMEHQNYIPHILSGDNQIESEVYILQSHLKKNAECTY